MAHWTSLLGSTLQGKGDEKLDTATHLAGDKLVLLYFSAHWCPPCRGFTPVLAELYKKLTDEGKNFEIVFISSDRSEADFNEYFGEMPWKALPFSDRDRKAALSKKFKVQGIPNLVILNPDGSILNAKGTEAVRSDKNGTNFPWKPKSLFEILALGSGKLIDNKGNSVDASSLKGKEFGIYFSAHWCPPCRGFTPVLVETYNKLKAAGKEFEIVFASSDKNQKQFDDYFGEMPWLSLGFDDERSDALSTFCDVEGIPQLSIFDANGDLVSNDGRAYVSGDKEGNEFPWRPKPFNSIEMASNEDLNSETCVIGIFKTDSAEDRQFLEKKANEHHAAFKRGENDEVKFFWTHENQGGITERLAEMFSATAPTILALSLPNYITVPATQESLNELLDKIHNGNIEWNSLRK